MRRLTILAALFFVALFIGGFLVEAQVDPREPMVLKADIQMDGAVMIEPTAQHGAHNFDTDPQLVGAISPFDTGFFGPQFVANISAMAPPAANAQSYVSPSPALSQIMLIKKGGIIPFGVASI